MSKRILYDLCEQGYISDKQYATCLKILDCSSVSFKGKTKKDVWEFIKDNYDVVSPEANLQRTIDNYYRKQMRMRRDYENI